MKHAEFFARPLTRPRLFKFALWLAILFAVCFGVVNWRVLLALLDTTAGAQAVALGAQLRWPIGPFIGSVVLACIVVPLFVRQPKSGPAAADRDHSRPAYDDSLAYGVNPQTGLPIDQYAEDSGGRPGNVPRS
jgi:hypothetical protein